MNRKDLIAELAVRKEIDPKESEEMVKAVFEIISEKLSCGEKVLVSGFGRFDVRSRNPRQARNIHTGERVHVPASKAPFFKPGPTLKRKIV